MEDKILLHHGNECVEIKNETGEILVKIDNRENLLEIDSKKGEIRLNGQDLPRVNSLHIHIDPDRTRAIIDLDVKVKKSTLLIDGEIKWYKEIDREKFLRGQSD